VVLVSKAEDAALYNYLVNFTVGYFLLCRKYDTMQHNIADKLLFYRCGMKVFRFIFKPWRLYPGRQMCSGFCWFWYLL